MQLTLKQALERRGLTLTELAMATGVNKSTVSRLLAGLTRPSYDTVRAMEAVLRVRLDFPTKTAAQPDRRERTRRTGERRVA